MLNDRPYWEVNSHLIVRRVRRNSCAVSDRARQFGTAPARNWTATQLATASCSNIGQLMRRCPCSNRPFGDGRFHRKWRQQKNATLEKLDFSAEELAGIEAILAS